MNKEPLYKARGDIYAGETKTRVEVTSVQAELELLVGEKEAPEVYNASESDLFELGPFKVILTYALVDGESVSTALSLGRCTATPRSLCKPGAPELLSCNLSKQLVIL